MPEVNRANTYSPEQMDCEYKKFLTNCSQCVIMGLLDGGVYEKIES